MPWATVGLILANQPWSGWYSVGKDAWTLAHTTQFTAPGWKYLDSSSGFIGGNRNNGSYVSLKSPNNSDYSTIIETMDATSAQQLDFTVAGGLSTGSGARVADEPQLQQHRRSLRTRRRHHALRREVLADRAARLPLHHHHHDRAGQRHRHQSGAGITQPALHRQLRVLRGRQAAQVPAGHAGCVRDGHVRRRPYRHVSAPVLAAGADHLEDPVRAEHVRRESELEQLHPLGRRAAGKTGFAQLEGRVGTTNLDPINRFNGYFLRASDTGAWSILRNNTAGQLTTLRSGTTAALGTGRWHNLKLGFNGSTITATIDGAVVGTVTDSTFGAGQVGFGTSQGQTAQFDNLQVYNGTPPVDPSPSPSQSSSSPSPEPSESSPSPSPSQSPNPAGGCSAAYKVVSEWTGGFQGEVTVTNNANVASTGWRATFTYADGQQVSQSWGATVTQSGSAVTASNVSYNGALAPGAATTFGFLASKNNANTAPSVSCTLS